MFYSMLTLIVSVITAAGDFFKMCIFLMKQEGLTFHADQVETV